MNWNAFAIVILMILLLGFNMLIMEYSKLTDKIRGYESDCLFRKNITFKDSKELFFIRKTKESLSDYDKRIIREFLALQLFAVICGVAFLIIAFFGNW